MLWNHAIPKLELDNFQCANLWVAFSPYLGPTFDPNSSWWNQGKFRRKKLGVAFVAWNPDGGINLELSPAAAFFAFSLPSFGPFAFFSKPVFFLFSNCWLGGSIFCFSFLGSDKMINDTNIGPDRAFEVRQRIKTKLEPKFLFIFMMWSILLSWKSQIYFPKFQIATRDKSGRIDGILVTIFSL